MRAIVNLCCGPRGASLAATLHLAEREPERLPLVLAELSALASLDRRQVLATFARLHRGAR